MMMRTEDEDSWEESDCSDEDSECSELFFPPYRSAETLLDLERMVPSSAASLAMRTRKKTRSGETPIRARNARRVISGSPGVYGHATPDESLVDHQEAMCMANVYKFAARCVAFPISQQLFNKALEPRENYLVPADLDIIERNCNVYLTSQYPGRGFTQEEWHNCDRKSDLHHCDLTIWWLMLQVGKSGRACKLVKKNTEEHHSRRFTKKCLLEIALFYAEHVQLKSTGSNNALSGILKEDIMHDLKMVTSPERGLSPEYYYDLLMRLLDINQSQHAAIYNDSKLGDVNEQIARIRSEVVDRASTLFSRRFSLQFKSDEEATIASNFKQKTFNEFEKLVKAAVSKSSSSTVHLNPAQLHNTTHNKRDRMRSTNSQSLSTNVNEFKIRFSVGEVTGMSPDKAFPYFCKFKCASSKSTCRTSTAIVNDGQLEFYSFEDFKTTEPNPLINIKLIRVKESLFTSADGATIAKKTVKIDLRQTQCCAWRTEGIEVVSVEGGHQDLKLKFKYEVEMSPKIKMLGHLHCEGCMIWKEPKVRFLILYEREKEEMDHEIGSEILQVFDHSSSQHAIPLLTEYDVTIHTRDQFKMGSAEYGHGFTLFKAGEEIKFYAKTEEEKSMWVDRLFKCTQQTKIPDDEILPQPKASWNALHVPSSPKPPKSPNPIDSEFPFFFPSSDGDIRANQGQHSKYFRILTNRMIDFCLETHRPLLCGSLPELQENLLMEYKIRYDITDAFYTLTKLDAYTAKVEDGVFVNPHIIQALLRTLKEQDCVKTMPEENNILEASQKLFESMKIQLRFIFDLFPYNLEEMQLFGYFLLLKELAKDCDRSVELGDIKQFTMDCFEQSMYNEYLKIAPTELYDAVSDTFMSLDPDLDIVKRNEELLEALIFKVIDFIEHFYFFYRETFRFLNINEEDVSQLLGCFLSMFNEDLPRLTARIPTHDKTIKKAFEMFTVLNNFCSELPPLRGREFHTESLHKAFLVHVLIKVERMSNDIITVTNSNLREETWAPVDTVDETEPFKCRSFMLLHYNLDGLSAEIEGLRWPNVAFRQVLINMVRDKTAQIKLKYSEVIEQRLSLYVTVLSHTKCDVTDEICHVFNFLLSLYSEVPTKLEKSSRMGCVTTNCMRMISSVLLRELNLILGEYEWDTLLSVMCYSSISNKIRRKRADGYLTYISKNLETIHHEVHPRFQKVFYEYLYKIHMRDTLSWLEKRKRFCEIQLEMIVYLVDGLRDIFATKNYLNNNSLNMSIYHSVKRVLDAEEIRLIGSGVKGLGTATNVLYQSASSVASFCSSMSHNGSDKGGSLGHSVN